MLIPGQGCQFRIVFQGQLLQVGVVDEGVSPDGGQPGHPAEVELLQGEQGLEGPAADLLSKFENYFNLGFDLGSSLV
jgi:hypothetical protein